MRVRNLSSLGVALLALAVCLGAKSDYVKPTLEVLLTRVPTAPVKHCTSINGLPDTHAACTPGAVLTTSKADICNDVSTTAIRPPDEYTDKLKVAQITEYGWQDKKTGDYEEDHLISLEIGGDPDDPRNLWPEPHAGVYGSLVKDRVENWLHKHICDGSMSVVDAQNGIKTNWKQYISQAPKVNEVE
jgi:hypothetical protein